MHKNSTFLILSLLLFSHCTQEKADIRVACGAVPPGNYRIKWETFPPMEGTVKIYESSLPDSFSLYSPIAESEISKGFKDIFFVQTAKTLRNIGIYPCYFLYFIGKFARVRRFKTNGQLL